MVGCSPDGDAADPFLGIPRGRRLVVELTDWSDRIPWWPHRRNRQRKPLPGRREPRAVLLVRLLGAVVIVAAFAAGLFTAVPLVQLSTHNVQLVEVMAFETGEVAGGTARFPAHRFESSSPRPSVYSGQQQDAIPYPKKSSRSKISHDLDDLGREYEDYQQQGSGEGFSRSRTWHLRNFQHPIPP